MPASRWSSRTCAASSHDPHHPYTAALLDALPERATGDRLPAIPGVVPGQGDRPTGCLFNPRCRFRRPTCAEASLPPVQPAELGHALCHYPAQRRGRRRA